MPVQLQIYVFFLNDILYRLYHKNVSEIANGSAIFVGGGKTDVPILGQNGSALYFHFLEVLHRNQ